MKNLVVEEWSSPNRRQRTRALDIPEAVPEALYLLQRRAAKPSADSGNIEEAIIVLQRVGKYELKKVYRDATATTAGIRNWRQSIGVAPVGDGTAAEVDITGYFDSFPNQQEVLEFVNRSLFR